MSISKRSRWLGAAVAATLVLIPASAQAGSGGTSPGGDGDRSGATVAGSKAKLVHGRAIPPEDAPGRVKRVIRAANKIRNKPYEYGGGHGSFRDDGYDCSGAVSYALHGGRLLKAPLDSTGLANWKRRGKGSWITVFGNSGHAYMVVAGLRWDTSMTPGNGPGWSKRMRSTGGYAKRHAGSL